MNDLRNYKLFLTELPDVPTRKQLLTTLMLLRQLYAKCAEVLGLQLFFPAHLRDQSYNKHLPLAMQISEAVLNCPCICCRYGRSRTPNNIPTVNNMLTIEYGTSEL